MVLNDFFPPLTHQEHGLRLRLFGAFEVWRGSQLIGACEWRRRKTLQLLKLLVVKRGKPYHHDELIEALYCNPHPETVYHNLLGRIAELRRALEPDLLQGAASRYILRVGTSTYCFSGDVPCQIDTEYFNESFDRGRMLERTEEWAQASTFFNHAIQLYRGDFMEDEPYSDWASPHREHWQAMYLEALEGLARCQCSLGFFNDAARLCLRVIEVDPYREAAYRLKMLCHHRAGDGARTYQTYLACRKAINDLGVRPAAETERMLSDFVQIGVGASGRGGLSRK